ncbi:hypothetical protein Daesc_005067 [Daldinia eschscholtzii]|uniref:DUF7726 domain-containing protein n=1 Tax=Daldinia eschscholtzii TaxID=292717 RepID=A0AAX6MK03_9PEZI
MASLDDYGDYMASLRARESAREAEIKDKVIMKLKEHGMLSDEQMDTFICDVVTSSQERYGNQQEQSSQTNQSRQVELKKEFDNLSLYFFKSAIRGYFDRHVPKDRCIQIFEDVISVFPNEQEKPPETKRNPREKPATPFSISRAAPGSVMSNAKLIDALAVATDMEPRTAIMIRGQITWCDSNRGGKSGMLDLCAGLVSGGRLGRDHMLADVPNNFVRDRLMDYIVTQLEDDKKERAKKAVFLDLSAAELEQYSALIMKKAEKNMPKTREQMISRIAGNKPLRTNSEINRVLDQADAMDAVDRDVGLTPQPGFGIRTYGRPGPIIRSVVQPGWKELTSEELRLDIGTDIDLDCDQIRAMIVLFINGKGWAADQFRLTLGNVSRPDLTAFLIQRGPKEGINSPVFQLAWEFFKKREALGLPLIDASLEISEDTAVLQEGDTNRTNKRQSTNGEGSSSGRKRTRRA